MQSNHVENFNGRLRDECLIAKSFTSLNDAASSHGRSKPGGCGSRATPHRRPVFEWTNASRPPVWLECGFRDHSVNDLRSNSSRSAWARSIPVETLKTERRKSVLTPCSPTVVKSKALPELSSAGNNTTHGRSTSVARPGSDWQ